MRLHIPILRRGSSRDSSESSPSPGETPVIYLRVQVISCQDLEAKDRNGYSDPCVGIPALSYGRFSADLPLLPLL
ncbi:hypothetical protein EDB89DRAFT_1957060 [Lactarius sanguifluus]|nr:hypothetical protein EDB89DRAFT_1957060 [Lactarius sanguifluus]